MVNVLSISNVKFYCISFLLPVSADKVVESTLSAAHRNDLKAFLDKAIGYCSADVRRSINHENLLVLERHF